MPGKLIQTKSVKKRLPVCRGGSLPQDRSCLSPDIGLAILTVDLKYQRKIFVDPDGAQRAKRRLSSGSRRVCQKSTHAVMRLCQLPMSDNVASRAHHVSRRVSQSVEDNGLKFAASRVAPDDFHRRAPQELIAGFCSAGEGFQRPSIFVQFEFVDSFMGRRQSSVGYRRANLISTAFSAARAAEGSASRRKPRPAKSSCPRRTIAASDCGRDCSPRG